MATFKHDVEYTSAQLAKEARVQIRKATDAEQVSASARAETLAFVSRMDLSGAPEGPTIETGEITSFLKETFAGRMGYTGWAQMDTETNRNSIMQRILREVMYVSLWAKDTNAFCDKNGNDVDGADVIPTPEEGKKSRLCGFTYIRNAAIPETLRDNDATDAPASFSKMVDYARKHFAKDGGGKHSKLYTLLVGIIDQDGEDGVLLPGDVQQNLDLIDDAQHVLELLAEEAAKIKGMKKATTDAVAA